MDIEASIEQVAGILLRSDLSFATAHDGRSYRLLFGTAGVFIHFETWGERSVLIKVSSPVVQDIEPGSPGEAEALNLLNRLNHAHLFVKFRLSGGTLIAEYDLLADTLQAGELLNAVLTVAAAADRLDDDLADRLGAKRYDMKLEEWEQDNEGHLPPPG